MLKPGYGLSKALLYDTIKVSSSFNFDACMSDFHCRPFEKGLTKKHWRFSVYAIITITEFLAISNSLINPLLCLKGVSSRCSTTVIFFSFEHTYKCCQYYTI